MGRPKISNLPTGPQVVETALAPIRKSGGFVNGMVRMATLDPFLFSCRRGLIYNFFYM